LSSSWCQNDRGRRPSKPFLGDPLEVYYHDYALGRRLEVMTHWRLTPDQVAEISEDELEVMSFGYRLCEKRNFEGLSDLIGTLLGASWSVDALTSDDSPDLADDEFTWNKRPPRQRVSLPLALVVGGNKVMEHVKKQAHSIKSKDRKDPSILSLPSSSVIKDAEIVDLSGLPKREFLKFFADKGID